MTSVFTGNLTKKIQITKTRNFQKWLREEALFDLDLNTKGKAFVPEDAVNVPRNKEDATKYGNARTRLTRRHRVIERILADELENLTGLLKW